MSPTLETLPQGTPWVGMVSRVVLLVMVIGLAIWATVANLIGGPHDTVSSYVRDVAERYPILLIALGGLLGHWFAPMKYPTRFPR